MIDSFFRIFSRKITKKTKTQIELCPFLRAKALQGCQIQIKVIVQKNIKVKNFGKYNNFFDDPFTIEFSSYNKTFNSI